MRKCIVFAVVIALILSFVPYAFASVGYKKDGADKGQITDIDFRGSNTSFNQSTVTVYANGHKDGVTTNVSTESNLTSAALAYGVILMHINSNSKYVSIANGSIGQMVTIIVTDLNGSGTNYITDDYVASGTVTKTGWDDIALTELNDSVTLLYVDDTYGWIIVGQQGATIT